MADVNINIFTNKVYKQGASTVVPGFIQGEEPTPINPSGSGGASEFVPYVGATENFDLGEFGMSAGFLKLDTTPTNTPTDQGTFYWDEDDNTVDIVLNGYIMKIGEDLFYPVKNQTGSSIAKGTNVRFAGTVGASGRLLIEPFTANGTFATSRYMGVTAETIADGEDGKVLWFGRIRGINTNAFNEGDILYASTTVAGGFQTTLPVAPNNVVEVCAVVTKSVNNGVIFVRPQFLSSGSKWTDGTQGIYRNSEVAINRTNTELGIPLLIGCDGILSSDICFIIRSNNDEKLLASFGGTGLFNIFSRGTTNAVALRVHNNSGTGTFTVQANGSILSSGSLTQDGVVNLNNRSFKVGNPSSPNADTTIRAQASNVDSSIFRLDSNFSNGILDIYARGLFKFLDASTFEFGTTTGTKIGTATSQKLSFWNATPIVQPTTAIAESAFVENAGGTAVNDDSTFDGYTLRQVVKALRDAGLLA